MKYIVLYTLLILLLLPGEARAQKQVYFLIPSARMHIHPEAMVDTMATGDTLVVTDTSLVPRILQSSSSKGDLIQFPTEEYKPLRLVSLMKRILNPFRMVYVFMPWLFFTAKNS